MKGKWKVRIERVINMPVTHAGRARFMVQNVLAATLACFVHGVSIQDIRVGLSTFSSGTAQTPGRLNFIEMGDFTVLMDYAHNPAGLTALRDFINQLQYKRRRVILNGTGDRRDEDLREMGQLCAETFDEVIIRRGNYLRGRDEEQMYRLLEEGINQTGKKVPVKIIADSREAMEYAFSTAQKNELIVTLGDRVSEDIKMVTEFRDKLSGAAAGA
jgi:cyanophycin synthetase